MGPEKSELTDARLMLQAWMEESSTFGRLGRYLACEDSELPDARLLLKARK
jgi:hypothetical protein